MIVQVVPGDPPIKIQSVTEIKKDGAPHWHIVGVPRTVRRGASGFVNESISYKVPTDYRGLKWVD